MAFVRIVSIVLVFALATAEVAQGGLLPGGGGGGGGYNRGPSSGTGGFGGSAGGDNSGPPQPYSFQYSVNDPPSGNDYKHQQSSDGNTVTGEYQVLLPDGRNEIVKYTASDATGYVADVQYEGEARYPTASGTGAAGSFGGGNRGNTGGYSGGSNVYLPPSGRK